MDGEGKTTKLSDMGDGSVQAISTRYEYDRKGNVTRETASGGDYKTYEYDGRNRLTAVRYFKADGTGTFVTKYTYSASDQVLSMEDLKVSGSSQTRFRYTKYTYNDLGELTGYAEYDNSASIPASSMAYEYNADGQVTSVSYGKAENHVEGLAFAYQEDGRLADILAVMDSGARNKLRSYAYTPDGKVSTIFDYRSFASGSTSDYIRRDYQYDRLKRVTEMVYRDSGHPDKPKETYAYTYDKNSNILTEAIYSGYSLNVEERVNELRTHSYDALGRLISTEIQDKNAGTSGTVTYTYDKAGNRLTMTEDGVTTSYTYNSLNQLLSARSADGDTVRSDISYSYDANGNLKEETDRVGNIKKSYAYDADSRLSSLQIQKEGTTILTQENLYNGDGQRICRQENGSAVYYYYQDGSLLAANNGNGSRQSFHLLGLEGNVIASGRYDGSHAGEYGIYNKDGRGSTTSIVNADGRSVATYEYTDFGETTVHGGGAFQNEICYTGGVYDESTGLYYLNARYYDPKDGRFLTQDTYRGEADAYATWHLYTYCANNPVNYVDPSGHAAVYGTIIAMALVIAVGLYATTTVQVSYSRWQTMDHSYYQGRKIVRYWEIWESISPTPERTRNKSKQGYRGKTVQQSKAGVKSNSKAKRKSKSKKKTAKQSKKERASNVPSWVRGERPKKGENGRSFAKRMMDEHYGEGNWKKGAGTQYNKIQKYGDRFFK